MIKLERITNFFNKFFDLKSKMTVIVSLSVCALILILFSLPIFLNNSELKFQIEQDISKSLDANFTINSDLEISFLPSISISAKNILLQNYDKKDKVYNFYAQSAKIDLSFVALLLGSFEIKQITFSQATLESYYNSNQLSRKNQFTTAANNILKNYKTGEPTERDSGFIAKISVDNLNPSQLGVKRDLSFVLDNCKTIFYDESSNKKEIQNIFGKIEVSKNKIFSTGEFLNENIINHFELEANFNSTSKWSSYLDLSSSIFNLRIKGIFSSENKGTFESEFEGNIEAEIFEIKPFYKSYIDNDSAFYKKLEPGINPIKISGDIESSTGEIGVKNIVINSNLMNGKGFFDANLASKTLIVDINLDLENLDLDSIWSSERIMFDKSSPEEQTNKNILDDVAETISQASQQKHLVDDTSNFLSDKVIKNIDLTSEIKVKNVKYLGGEIKNVDLYLTASKEGEILVLPLIFKVPGGGIVRLNGSFYQNKNFPKFVGKFDATGKKLQDIFKWLNLESQNLKFDNLKSYILYSDILLTPNNVSLDNLYLNLNNDESEFLGEVRIDGSDKTMRISNKFRISSFNADDYFLVSGQNIYLSPGSLLKKILWLNDIRSDNKLELAFDTLIYKGEEFSDQSLELLFGQGYFEIVDLQLKSDATDLSATLKIDISDNQPYFEMNITANSFHYKSLQNNEIFGLKNIENNSADQFFALPSLENFNGRVSFNFNKLNLDDLEIKNAELSGNLQNGNIEDTLLNCNLYGGDFSYKGMLGMKFNKTVNGNIFFNNLQLGEILPSLVDIDNIDGVANVSASLTSSANKKEEFISNISSKIKFNANSPTINRYGLDSLIRKMFDLRTYRQELQDPEAVLFNPESKTILKKASGTIRINKNKGNKFKVNVSGLAFNGIVSGNVDLVSRKIDGLANIVFLTGNRTKQIPINIATSLKGNFGSVSHATNLDQAKQYLGLLKGSEKKPSPPQKISQDSVRSNKKPKYDPKSLSEIRKAMANPDAYLRQKQKQNAN